MEPSDSPIYRYHDGTKHYFDRIARSLGYLDWATQPRPFRTFAGSPSFLLYPAPDARADGYQPVAVGYEQLFRPPISHTPFSAGAIGDLLRHSLGLSAWKVYGSSRWSLRVNPSSGNLHPTEAYIICGDTDRLASSGAVYHYAPERHALEQRCAFEAATWNEFCGGQAKALVALTSIHWRESWKYGERAFRYCQHDLGHAVAAIRLAAATLGWHAALVPQWSHRQIASLTGIDRDEDFVDAEREEPGCLLLLTIGSESSATARDGTALLDGVRAGRWTGRASQLSEDHIQWTFIDEIASATEDPGHPGIHPPVFGEPPELPVADDIEARRVIIQRRSALAFDGRSSISDERFFRMLARTLPDRSSPLAALWWTPRIHFAIFVHRVTDVEPGLYLFGRDPQGFERLLQAISHGSERAHDTLPLVCAGLGDCRGMARRLSCDQDIASDGCFSLAMIADFDASLSEFGPSFYRHLFWESGAVGQILYLEAEAAGIGATGIGCFYDEPVHEVLGLRDHGFQSIYHFTIGAPVEDTRLTTESGYPWG